MWPGCRPWLGSQAIAVPIKRKCVRVLRLLLATAAGVLLALIAFVHLAPETATHLALDVERARSGLVRKEIDLPGGIHYVYLEGGSGEPLMLFHGFGANKDNFTRV